MLKEHVAKAKRCVQSPNMLCQGSQCVGWATAQRNQPDDEGDWGQCIYVLALQAHLDLTTYVGALVKPRSSLIN